MDAVILLMLLFQNADHAPAIQASVQTQQRETQLRQVASAAARQAPSGAETNAREYAAGRDQEFVGKFNKLIGTLMEFADSYKNGQAIDIKKAKAIRRAWLELEKSEAVFQDDKK